MNIMFEANSGDLGRGIKVSPAEFMFTVPHVANIFRLLYESHLSDKPFCYGFEFDMINLDRIVMMIASLEKGLPAHVRFFRTDGRVTFELKQFSGGVAPRAICYLITGVPERRG